MRPLDGRNRSLFDLRHTVKETGFGGPNKPVCLSAHSSEKLFHGRDQIGLAPSWPDELRAGG